jgi:hypothetical protein
MPEITCQLVQMALKPCLKAQCMLPSHIMDTKIKALTRVGKFHAILQFGGSELFPVSAHCSSCEFPLVQTRRIDTRHRRAKTRQEALNPTNKVGRLKRSHNAPPSATMVPHPARMRDHLKVLRFSTTCTTTLLQVRGYRYEHVRVPGDADAG